MGPIQFLLVVWLAAMIINIFGIRHVNGQSPEDPFPSELSLQMTVCGPITRVVVSVALIIAMIEEGTIKALLDKIYNVDRTKNKNKTPPNGLSLSLRYQGVGPQYGF